jgi:hypothetical protein
MIAVFLSGCGGVGVAGLSSSESALVEDSDDVDTNDDAVESGVEDPLSGSDTSSPGALDPAATMATQITAVRTNPGKFFMPAGCIVTTISGNVATSVFTNCTGPLGQHTFNGTVTSTWTFAPGSLTVTHSTSNFKIDNASVTHDATIEYSKSGTTYTRHRSGHTTAITARGETLDHTFDTTVSYDPTTRCVTRDGSSMATIGSRKLSRTITGYERCGVGELGCPQSGTLTLSRTNLVTLTLTLSFPGGAKVDITRPNGTEVTRPLICIP